MTLADLRRECRCSDEHFERMVNWAYGEIEIKRRVIYDDDGSVRTELCDTTTCSSA